jgi:DNA polymerase-3 subunit delta'
MIDLSSLVKSTNAYKIVKSDKERGRLSHAYLIVCADGDNLEGYLKEFAKLFFCKNEGCGECRECKLIDQKIYADALFLPREGESISADDITALVQDTFVKPLESDKKLYVLSNAESMNAVSQNKLLKTLEEPPKNVHILIGATGEYSLLSTVKSRVRKLEIPPFSANALFNALKDECQDSEKLKGAIACSDGTLGKTLALYKDESLMSVMAFVEDMFINMQSSSQVLEYSYKFSLVKCEIEEFLSVTELFARDMLVYISGAKELVFSKKEMQNLSSAKGFTRGALIGILQAVVDARKRLDANSGKNMVLEWLLFKILEEKFRWQKL